MFFAEYLGTRIFTTLISGAVVPNQQFNQNMQVPVSVQVTNGSSTPQDMTGWTASCAIVGAPGNTEGQDPGSPLAAYQNSLLLQGDNKTFQGTMNCNTSQMKDLLTVNPRKPTVFAIKFVSGDLSEVFEVQCSCIVQAAAIRSGAQVSASNTPVAFSVMAGQSQATFGFPNLAAGSDLSFIKYTSGPQVDTYAINVNDDNAALNTVTVTLAGVATLGGMNFRAYLFSP